MASCREVSDYQMSGDEGRRNNRINKQQQLINRVQTALDGT